MTTSFNEQIKAGQTIRTVTPGIEDAGGGGFHGVCHVTLANGKRVRALVTREHLGLPDDHYQTLGQVHRFQRDADALNAGLALFHAIRRTGDPHTTEKIDFTPLD